MGARSQRAGGSAACGRRAQCACAARAHKRGETKFSPLLRITPFPFSGSRQLSVCPKICGICCRKSGRADARKKCVAPKFSPPAFHKQQEGASPCPLWGGSQTFPIALAGGWHPLGGDYDNRARGAPDGKWMIGKKEETTGFFLLVRPPRRRNPPVMRGHSVSPCQANTQTMRPLGVEQTFPLPGKAKGASPLLPYRAATLFRPVGAIRSHNLRFATYLE